jgi:hypothetical protein
MASEVVRKAQTGIETRLNTASIAGDSTLIAEQQNLDFGIEILRGMEQDR